MAERLYATASQHIELAQYICYLLNDPRRHPISTSTRLYLLDLLIDLHPSPDNRHFRLDLRTFHILRRTLWEMAQGRPIGERHFLQDVLRWTVVCHRERVRSRLRWSAPATGEGGAGGGGGSLRGRIRGNGGHASVRCHRCHQYGKGIVLAMLMVGHRMAQCIAVV
jgi:hypothetical protein